MDDAKFGPAYINAMVKGHTEVLSKIDSEWLKKAENESVKKFITTTREHVAMHLEKAKQIQATLKDGEVKTTQANP